MHRWLTRIRLAAMALALVLLPFTALAQSSMELPGGDTTWKFAASILAMVLIAIARAVWKDASAKREQVFAWAVSTAYHATNELAAMTENTVDDKVASALGFLDEALKAQRGSGATAAEQAKAQLAWKAMHGAEKKAEELAIGAVVPALP